ncbi:hypothetical protein NARC_10233 [Candidatus Nitrosocosmicus arcticus]|uniref:Uncharacterized protein n=1 Tax=Candidatus Nitrosocosmicus arcticus TaxID=2035267 RepID=A0A557SYZ3_9ARCH|nr:hypothetical protein NARC_10233 [Candidatus Nitrosocosmicus arcticus]
MVVLTTGEMVQDLLSEIYFEDLNHLGGKENLVIETLISVIINIKAYESTLL